MRLNDIERRVRKDKLKLSVIYTLFTLGIVVILMVSFYALYSNTVYRNFDTSIMQRATSIASTLSGKEEINIESLSSLKLSQNPFQSGNEVIEITDNKGKVVFSLSAVNNPKISIVPNNFSFGTYIEEINNKAATQKIRAYTASIEKTQYLVTVGMPYEEINNSLKNIIVSFLLIIPFIIIVTGLASYKLANVAISPIEKSYRELKQFTEDASHELKTPVAAIKANIDVALSKDVKETTYYREKLRIINDSVNRMTNIITSMLHLSKMDSGSYEFKKEKTNLVTLLKEIETRFADSAIQKNIILNIDSKDVNLETNKEALEEILNIVVENAINFNKPTGEVKIFTELNDRNTKIYVEDTGIGISKEDLPHIFDRFYRGEKSRSRETGGAGLGLSIAYNLAKAIGANIEVKSKESVGSTFTITIPGGANNE